MSAPQIAYKFHPCGYKKCRPCYMKDYEAAEIDYTCNYLNKVAEAGKLNGVFVDVGAHAGLWSLQMSEWYQCRFNIKPTIYAIEADMDNFITLKRNALQAQTGIVPVHAAAWLRNTWLFVKKRENPAQHKVVDVAVPGGSPMRVNGIALDSSCPTHESKQIDAIKIDVEGAELNAVNGARQILMANDQMLAIIEYSVGHFEEYGYKPKQLTALMGSCGFRPARTLDKRVTEDIRAGQIKRVMFVKGDIV